MLRLGTNGLKGWGLMEGVALTDGVGYLKALDIIFTRPTDTAVMELMHPLDGHVYEHVREVVMMCGGLSGQYLVSQRAAAGGWLGMGASHLGRV